MIIFIAFLFILQLISIYFIMLLFMRVNQFKQLEQKQQRLMVEMEDAIAAYLVEVKEENERFIDELASDVERIRAQHASEESSEPTAEQSSSLRVDDEQQEKAATPPIARSRVIQSYGQQTQPKSAIKETEETPIASIEQSNDAFTLHAAGYSVEDIAKKLNKGKTEVELMLKFSKKE